MTGFHPNNRQFAWPRIAKPLAVGLAFCLVGCTNQQMSASNPFLGPDRVPPPATRTIAPGTAAPYYPGSPVPAAQIAPAAPPIAQAPSPWQLQPPAAAPATMTTASPAAAPPAVAPLVAAASPAQPLAFSGEPTVAIPADNQGLRFALPSPPQVSQVASPPIQPQPTSQLATMAAPAPASAAVPAAYQQPVAYQPSVPVPTPTSDTDSSGPWRAPLVPKTTSLPQSASPVMQAQYVQPQAAPPTMLVAQPQQIQPQPPAAPQMPVELRPTTAPQTAPAAAVPMAPTVPPPRMRFPSLLEPSTWFTPQPAANQQLVGYMVPGPDGQMHMISVEQYQATLSGGAQPAASVASSDGFRARGTSTK